jgi:hypothetical protein
MKRFLFGLALPLLAIAPCWADMRLEILDLATRAARITYDISDNKPGNRIFLFPTGGFIHDAKAGNFQVESVFDIAAKRELPFTIVSDPDTKLPQLKITYDAPIRPGENRKIQIAVKLNMPEDLVQRDENGRFIFKYETSHKFEFITPLNHYVVNSNLPITLFEKGDRIIVQQLDDKPRTIVIQTRPLR